MKIINNTMQPIMLESGQMLPAGATRDDIQLTQTDRVRHVPARITVIEEAVNPGKDDPPPSSGRSLRTNASLETQSQGDK